jgi:hypothetical protein
LEEIVAAVTARTKPEQGEEIFYATRVDNKGAVRLVQISNLLAAVINVCDGSQTVAEVLNKFAAQLPQLDEEVRSEVSRRLLTGAQAAGFVEIYRATRDTPDLAGPFELAAP